MSIETKTSNKNNILFLFFLVFAVLLHTFLGKLILDNIRSFGIIVGIVIILVGLHLTLGRKIFHKGGVTG